MPRKLAFTYSYFVSATLDEKPEPPRAALLPNFLRKLVAPIALTLIRLVQILPASPYP
jgi:hypothetical protein